jgi:lipopolysaccharide biosynthesis glycosyltransferase
VITEPYARLVVLDADMVVNSSLRPLFESNMRGFAVGAIRDPLSEPELIARGRKLDPSYLNSGLLLINVDEWNEQGLGDAAMRRLASYSEPPIWPDQDALNDVVGNDWLRLNRKWNLFYAGEPQQFTPEEYRAASIVHFAGAKPTHAWDHPAIALYRHHHERFVAKTFHAKSDHEVRVDWDFIATAYEVFLGRDLETVQVVADRGHWSALAVLKSVINCFECDTTVLEPIRKKRHFQAGRHRGAPSIRQKLWAADRLPLLDATAKRVRDAEGWRDMLEALFGDERLMEWCGLGPVLPDETPEPQALPEPQAALDTASETAPRLEPEGVLNA